MINVLKKCSSSLIFTLVFMFLSIFSQFPVISAFSDERIHVSDNLNGDMIRIALCIVLTLLSLYFLSLFAKRQGIHSKFLSLKQESIDKKRLVIYSLEIGR